LFDLLIRNATIIDGTRATRFRGDIGVVQDRIAAIGDLAAADAEQVLDTRGKIAAPGFIDVHNHSDGWLLNTPNLLCKTTQGITTEVLMSDGISYAPVDEHTWRDWFFYLRALNGLRMDEYAGWQSIDDYLQRIDGATAQNAAAQIPYANVRALACGWGRAAPDDFQMRQILNDVRTAMEQGAVGLSTGLDYIVQCFATTDELVEVCAAVAEYDGLYATHVRYKKGLLPAVEEAIEIARRSGVRLHISHLKGQSPGEVEQVLTLLDRAGRDIQVGYDAYPYQPGSTMLSYLVPNEIWEDGVLASLGKLSTPVALERFARGLEAYRLDLDQIRIAWVASKGNSVHQGKTLSNYIEELQLPAGDALSRLLWEERYGVLLVFDEGDDQLITPLLQHDLFMLGSDGIYFPDGDVHPRAYGSAPRIAGRCVRDWRLFDLETAVHKMTQRPAEWFRLKDRGVLRESAFADIVVFDETTISDISTYDDPRRLSEGVEALVVNGQQVLDGQEPLAATPGRRVGMRND
jgi:N-acyl-D-amino-acid deacylase